MIPIGSVFNDIAKTFPNTPFVNIDVPSGKCIDDINQSKKATTVCTVSNQGWASNQTKSVTHIRERDSNLASARHIVNGELLSVAVRSLESYNPRGGVSGKFNAPNIRFS